MIKKLLLAITVSLLASRGFLQREPTPQVFERNVTLSVTPTPCVDTLGAAKYGNELKAIPLNYGIGVFARTFGDAFPVVKKELERGRKYIRVNLLWSDAHAYGNKDLPFIRNESKRYNALCVAHPDATIEIAPFTEHNISKPDPFLAEVKRHAPNCDKPINSVWNGSLTKNPEYKNEIHGNHSVPKIQGVAYNYSYDGTNSVDSDFVAMQGKHAKAELFCAWHPRLNGKWSMKDTTPRPQRKAWPNKELLESLVYLFTDKGFVTLPKNWLVKSHAEKHGPEDKKGDKLLIIAPIRANEIILKKEGKKTGTLPYYGPFDGGGFRYYAPQFGYKYGPYQDVFIGQKKHGTINGGFRHGNYRD